jgi:uncharacterized protein (DUF486 family)
MVKTILLLAASNVFMTFAWYYHLGPEMKKKSLLVAILVSWGIAFFEYILQVPANRAGDAAGLKLAQLKILQEVITLTVFVPFAMLMMGEKFRLDFLWAALCMLGAVYFVFRPDRATPVPNNVPTTQQFIAPHESP